MIEPVARATAPSGLSGRPVLEIVDLTTTIRAGSRELLAVDNLSLAVAPGQIVGVVGESGSGKTLTALSIMRLLAPNVRVRSGAILLEGKDLLQLPMSEMRSVRGRRVSMVFQEPMTSLDPAYSIGSHLIEASRAHGLPMAEAKELAEHMLERVGIAEPGRRMRDYPHQFSGGMRQRVTIALALQLKPVVLVADEPTTALDVTLQAQILDLISALTREMHLAVVLITHDLGVVSEVADEVAVMYAGRIVERGPVASVFATPAHPYTDGLLSSVRSRSDRLARLHVIPGRVPDPTDEARACTFAPRCDRADARCLAEEPMLPPGRRSWRCFHPLNGA